MEFKRYKELVEKYYQNDCRELNFQNRVIIPFLEKYSPNFYDVVDSSTLYRNWERYKYDMGNGVCRGTFAEKFTPDLLVIKNWKLFAERKEKPRIIVEVKRPTANSKSERTHADKEIKEYMGKADYVILTNCITWEFYKKGELIEPIICLEKDKKSKVCERMDSENRTINWVDEENAWLDIKTKLKSIID